MILIKNRLNAGFFSNLNAVLGWYWYSMRTEIPIYIQWDGIVGQNIFDMFFNQKYKYDICNFEHNANFQHSPLFTDQIKDALREDVGNNLFDKYKGWWLCQGSIYNDPDFYKLRQLYNYIYTENLKLHSEIINEIKIPQKTLGVNFRFLHFFADKNNIPFNSFMSANELNKKFLDEIESVFETGNYNNIYLACSQQLFFDLCLEKFKDKVLYIPLKRLEINQIETTRGITLIEEYTKVLEDVINLSKCDHLLITPSNMMFGLLYLNPTITFQTYSFLKDVITG